MIVSVLLPRLWLASACSKILRFLNTPELEYRTLPNCRPYDIRIGRAIFMGALWGGLCLL